MLHAMAGAVPSEYHWLSSIAGFKGTIEQGMGELDSLFVTIDSAEYDFIKPEVALLLFYMKTNFENVSKRKIITALFSDSALLKNPLVAFSYSGFLMKQGKAKDAIAIPTMETHSLRTPMSPLNDKMRSIKTSTTVVTPPEISPKTALNGSSPLPLGSSTTMVNLWTADRSHN